MEKKSWEEPEKRKSQERRSEKRKSQTVRRKKMQVRKKVEKVAKHSVLQFFVAGRKVGSLKRRVRSHLCDEKLHAAMARSTFRSQNVQNTLFGSLLEDEMLKSSQRCRTKHVSKSKCTKYFSLGAHLEVEMLKKRTPMWREAHYEVKMLKYLSLGLLLEVEMLKKRMPL